jgi:membrane protease YdiL (CAAX protease family)
LVVLGVVVVVVVPPAGAGAVVVCSVVALKQRKGFWTAVNVSLAVRLTYHLYQRAVGVVDIAPIGLIFRICYARSGRLWPLIVAHALIDILSLLRYVSPGGGAHP